MIFRLPAQAGRHPSPALALDRNLQEMGPCLLRGSGDVAGGKRSPPCLRETSVHAETRTAVKPSPLRREGWEGGVLYAGPSQLRLIGTADKPSHLSPEGERAIGCAALGHRFGEKNKTRSGASRFNALGNHEMRGAAGSHSSPRGPSHGQRPEVPPSECMSRLMKAPALTKGQMAISREHSEWT